MKTAGIPVALAIAFLSGPAFAQTVDEIIAKNVAARGGIEKLREIQAMIVTSRVETSNGKGPLLVHLMRPKLIRQESTVGAARTVRAYDGQTGWVLESDATHEAVRKLTDGALELMIDEALFGIDGKLADYAAKGTRVKLEGVAVAEGKTCYSIKVTLHTGHVIYEYVDTESYLEIHEESHGSSNGNPLLVEQTIGDYRSEGGILFAHSIVTRLAGHPERTTLTVEKIELNPTMDEGIFQMPAAKEGASPPPSPTQPPQASLFSPALPGKKLRAARSA